MIKPFLSDNSVLVFDDIHWSEGMLSAWTEIIENEENIIFSIDLVQLGICVYTTNKKTNIGNFKVSLF